MLSVAATLRGSRATLSRTTRQTTAFRNNATLSGSKPRSSPSSSRLTNRLHSTVATEEASQSIHVPPSISSSLRAEVNSTLHSYTLKPTRLEPIRIVCLPELKPSEPREAGKFAEHQLSEQMAIMYACLSTGELDRARRVFLLLHKNNPEDMLVLGDIKMHNSFMESYMTAEPSPKTKEALKWFESLTKYKVKPDLTTFAILIKGFIRYASLFVILYPSEF